MVTVLAAAAVVIAATGNGTTSILLLGVQADCPKGSQLTVAVTPERKSYSYGCWTRRGDEVYIVPKAGEPVTMPARVFTWAEEV